MARQPRPAIELPLPAPLEVIAGEARNMLRSLEAMRAQAFVQQVTNGHGDDDAFVERDGEPVSYTQRRREIDQFEQNLRDGLPKAVLERLEADDAER